MTTDDVAALPGGTPELVEEVQAVVNAYYAQFDLAAEAEAEGEPIIDQAGEPVFEPVAEQLAEQDAGAPIEAAADPVPEAAEPVAELSAEPVAELAAEPVAEQAVEQAQRTEPLDTPTVEGIDDSNGGEFLAANAASGSPDAGIPLEDAIETNDAGSDIPGGPAEASDELKNTE